MRRLRSRIRSRIRAAAVTGLVTALAGTGLAVAAPAPAHAATSSDASAAMSSFVSAFWDPAAKYFFCNSDHQVHSQHAYGPDGGLYSDFWWEAQNWETVMDAYQATGDPTYRQMIDDVYTGFTAFYPTFTTNFNDDLGWWALASARAYDITGESQYLTTAENLFNSVYAYQDSTYGGGIWWQRNLQNQKNVASSAPAAEAAAMIYKDTGNTTYLTDAQGLYSWMKSTLQSNGHVYDHIDGSGVAKWDFTYNFGAYIGAADALYTATNDSTYLTDANAAGSWATTYLTNAGTLDYEGVDDAGGFKAVLIRDLAHLVSAHGQTQYLPFLQMNVNQGLNQRRSSDSLVGPDWSQPTGSAYLQSLTAGAMASAAAVVTPDGTSSPQPNFATYQATNARTTNLTSESTNPGFSGRGYLAGWNADGQSVTFEVQAPAAGTYEMALRYAGGAGDATRQISVNGSVVAGNQLFPGTGGWSNWSTATLNGVALNQGYNEVTIAYSSGAGSSNYLNLDSMRLSYQLQAENGVLHGGIGLESSNAGYTGTGYLAGWNTDGQWVDLSPNVSRSGTYTVTFRYAAAAGNASRYIYVNSTDVTDNLAFPGTASWSAWNTVTLSGVHLNAGSNTFSVIYDSTKGSSNYLNLDEVTVQYTGG